MKSVVIAENSRQVNWAIKNGYRNIIPCTYSSQLELAKANVDPEFFLQFLPPSNEAQTYLDTADSFANHWYEQLRYKLSIGNGNLGVFSRTHWLFFIPELLRSHYILTKILAHYQPDEMIIFPKEERLDVATDTRNLLTFLLRTSHNYRKWTNTREITLDLNNVNNSLVLNNIHKYVRQFLKKPEDIPLAISTLLQKQQQVKITPATDVSPVELLLQLQRHIFIDSLPLLKELKERHIKFKIVSDSLLLSQRIILRKAGIDFWEYQNLMPKSEYSENLDSLVKFWDSWRVSTSYEFLLKKNRLHDFTTQMTLQFEAIFTRFAKEVCRAMAKADLVFQKTLPRGVILAGNSGRRGLAFAYSAKKFKATSFLFMHGVDITPIQSSNVFDKMLVWGSDYQKWYQKKMMIPAERYFAPGWFYTDNIALESEQFRQKNKRMMTNKRPTILVALSDYLVDNDKQFFIIRNLIKELRKIESARIFIRPHPGGRFTSDILKIFSPDIKKNIIWDYGTDLDEQIKKSDLIIVQGTTVGLRAMYWGKPLIHIKIRDVIDGVDFSEHGAAVNVFKIEDIIPNANLLLNDSQARNTMFNGQERFLQGHCNNADGRASKRVVEFIQKELKYDK